MSALETLKKRFADQNMGRTRRAAVAEEACARLVEEKNQRRENIRIDEERILAIEADLIAIPAYLDQVDRAKKSRLSQQALKPTAPTDRFDFEALASHYRARGASLPSNGVISSVGAGRPVLSGDGLVYYTPLGCRLPDPGRPVSELHNIGTSHLHRGLAIPGYTVSLIRIERQRLPAAQIDDMVQISADQKRPPLSMLPGYCDQILSADVARPETLNWICDKARNGKVG